MKGILWVARVQLVTALRERETLFWFVIFPVFILALLASVVGSIGKEGEMNFDLTLVNLAKPSSASVDFAAIVERAFEETGKPPAPGKRPLFTLHRPAPGEDSEAFLVREEKALRIGRRAVVVVLPEGFNEGILGRAGGAAAGPSGSTGGRVLVYYTKGSDASEIAASIVEQVLAGVDQRILAESGRFQTAASVPTETRWVGVGATEIAYVDFLLPGVILMGFFLSGLFGVPGSVLFARDRKILQRYWVTPLEVRQYLAGFSLGHLGLCVCQFFLLLVIGRYAFGAKVLFAELVPVLFLVLSAVTFLAFGFFIAAVVRTANAGMALANLLNMPMLFLSGLFFPVRGLPLVLKAIVYANPMSYLVEGLRTSLGVGAREFPLEVTFGVPLLWIAVCTLVASRRLQWDVGR